MTGTWQQFSKEISEVVGQGGKSIVAVDGRAEHTSSGIVWRRDSVLTAAHAIRRETNIGVIFAPGRSVVARRSEEHTSELQSPCNLVCRLLLEKKRELALDRQSSHKRLSHFRSPHS